MALQKIEAMKELRCDILAVECWASRVVNKSWVAERDVVVVVIHGRVCVLQLHVDQVLLVDANNIIICDVHRYRGHLGNIPVMTVECVNGKQVSHGT